MIPSPNFSQTALEALNLLQKARDSHLTATVSEKGNVKILHTAHMSAKPGSAATLTIIEAVINKLQNEAAATAVVTGRNILGLLSHRLPSLNHFVMTGHLGNLREEWQQYRQELDQSSQSAQTKIEAQQKVQQERLMRISEAYDFLPKGLQIGTEENSVSKLDYAYSFEDQKKLIEACKLLQVDEVDATTGLTKLTQGDIKRHEYTFKEEINLTPSSSNQISETGIAVRTVAIFGNNLAAEKIAAAKDLTGNSLAAKTLFKFTNQVIFSALQKVKEESLDTVSGKIPMFNKSTSVQRFTMLRKLNGDIEINFLNIKKSKIMASEDGSKQWQIGSGQLAENPASENDYTEKYSATVLAKKADLEKGIIGPEYIDGSYSICISVSAE